MNDEALKQEPPLVDLTVYAFFDREGKFVGFFDRLEGFSTAGRVDTVSLETTVYKSRPPIQSGFGKCAKSPKCKSPFDELFGVRIGVRAIKRRISFIFL
jgi:hypothetical protein